MDVKERAEFRQWYRETKGYIIYTLPSGKLQYRRYNPNRVKRGS